jgi:hypothetical protein
MKLVRVGISGLVVSVALALTVVVAQSSSWTISGAVAAPEAATCTWNGSNGNWSDSSKWSCGIVPGASDTAIINGGTVIVSAPTTIGTLAFSGTYTTSLTGTQPLTIATVMTWTGLSRLLGTGLTTIDTNATLVVSHTSGTGAFERPMMNKGKIDLISSSLYASAVPASGVFTNTNTGQVNLGGQGVFKPYQFINYGVVRNSDNNAEPVLGGGDILTYLFFENYGTIVAQNGNLNLGGVINNHVGGNITLANGNLVCYNEFGIDHVGSINLNGGTLSGNGSATCGVYNSGGLVAPGASPGTLLIAGPYVQQAGGTLNIEIGGPDLKGYDALIVAGEATLDGALHISLINGYAPTLFDGFAIVRYNTHSGTFASVTNPIAATHPLSYTTNQITLGTPQRHFQTGDLFVGVGHGQVKEFDSDGNLVAVLNSTTNSRESAGMCFDANGNLFATMFQAYKVSKFSNAGTLISSTFGTGYPASPESCVFDAAGNIYIGQAGFSPGTGALQKRDANGTLLTNYTVQFEDRGADWIDLAPDQRTLLYTSEGTKIFAYDVVTPEQKPDFATGLLDPCYATRLRQNGEMMTACSLAVYRLSPTGTVVMSYTAASLGEIPPNPEQGLFALTLDSDGTSFWTAGYFSGKVHKVDIATGTVLKTFGTSPFTTIAGLTVYGEIQVGRPGLALAETVGTDPASCAPTREITATVGMTVTYCYRVINTGSLTLTTHSLTDSVHGGILSNLALSLAPGASTFVTRAATINATTQNVAVWSATSISSTTASATDFTRVNVGVTPPVLDKKLYLPLIRK